MRRRYHETLDDAEVVVDDLGEGSQAVGCAGSVAVETGSTRYTYKRDKVEVQVMHRRWTT